MSVQLSLTETVMKALPPGQWRSCAQVIAALPESAPNHWKASAGTILSQKARGGVIERRGESRAYEYRRPSSRSEATAPVPQEAPGRDAPAPAPAALAPGLGTITRPPANRAQGNVQEALRTVLDADEGSTLDEVLEALPMGWSRAEAIGALSDGVHAEWVRTERIAGVTHYLLVSGEHAARPPAAVETATEPPLRSTHTVTTVQVRIADQRLALRQLLADASTDFFAIPDSVLVELATAAAALGRAIPPP